MAKIELPEEVLQSLNNFLFDIFFEISSLYSKVSENLQKILISLLVVEDFKSAIEQTLAFEKEHGFKCTPAELEEIKALCKKLLILSALVHADGEKIRSAGPFKNFSLQESDIRDISFLTKIAIESVLSNLNQEAKSSI